MAFASGTGCEKMWLPDALWLRILFDIWPKMVASFVLCHSNAAGLDFFMST